MTPCDPCFSFPFCLPTPPRKAIVSSAAGIGIPTWALSRLHSKVIPLDTSGIQMTNRNTIDVEEDLGLKRTSYTTR